MQKAEITNTVQILLLTFFLIWSKNPWLLKRRAWKSASAASGQRQSTLCVRVCAPRPSVE